MRRITSIPCLLTLSAAALSLGGCMGALECEGPEKLTITAAQYQQAFDAATRAAKEMGYRVVLVDRSNGIIETDARHAGGALEPWRIDNAGPSDAAGNTLANRRRKIRVEFIPVDAAIEAVTADAVLRGAAIPGSTRAQERFDVQTCAGPIEVEVWVYLERSFVQGTNPSTSSGSLASTWTNRLDAKAADANDQSIRDRGRWTPMGRDDAYERTISARIAEGIRVQ